MRISRKKFRAFFRYLYLGLSDAAFQFRPAKAREFRELWREKFSSHLDLPLTMGKPDWPMESALDVCWLSTAAESSRILLALKTGSSILA